MRYRSLFLTIVVALTASLGIAEAPRKKPVMLQEAPLWITPSSMHELRDKAAVIARVQVLAAEPKVFPGYGGGPSEVRTEHRVQVIEIYKNNSAHPLEIGREADILQYAGRIETDTHILEVPDQVPYPVESELIVFLRWAPSLEGYEVISPLATFFVQKGKIVPAAESEIGENRRNWPIEKLGDELRGRIAVAKD